MKYQIDTLAGRNCASCDPEIAALVYCALRKQSLDRRSSSRITLESSFRPWQQQSGRRQGPRIAFTVVQAATCAIPVPRTRIQEIPHHGNGGEYLPGKDIGSSTRLPDGRLSMLRSRRCFQQLQYVEFTCGSSMTPIPISLVPGIDAAAATALSRSLGLFARVSQNNFLWEDRCYHASIRDNIDLLDIGFERRNRSRFKICPCDLLRSRTRRSYENQGRLGHLPHDNENEYMMPRRITLQAVGLHVGLGESYD